MRKLQFRWILICFSYFMSLSLSFGQTKPKTDKMYSKEWKAIEELERQDKTKSALEAVQTLYANIEKQKTGSPELKAQAIKALIYINKYQVLLEEADLLGAIERLQKSEKAMQDAASKRLLKSMLAELYHDYLQQNRYKLSRVTSLAEGQSTEDVKTWDLNRLTQEIYRLYLESLEDEALSQSLKLEDFETIIEGAHLAYPSLYDF